MFFGKPLCVAVYPIATEDPALTPEQIVTKTALPSQMIMDNAFYYGEFKIIGNIPLTEQEKDYPIHYGKSFSVRENSIHYQCGKVFLTLENQEPLYSDFRNSGIGWRLLINLPLLRECIEQDSNKPYWDTHFDYSVQDCDLRNPKFAKELKQIRKQMGIK